MQGEVHSEPDFDGIIGQSPGLKAVLALAREMAVSDGPSLDTQRNRLREGVYRTRDSSHQRKKKP